MVRDTLIERLVWVIPALPLAGALINATYGRRLGRAAGWVASAAVGGAFLIALLLLFDLLPLPGSSRELVQELWTWIPVGSLQVDVAFRVDPLSLTMVLVVTGVSTLIHVYSIGYMERDARYARYFFQLNLFVFFMLLLVLADNYLLLYVGWEGVGLCSYLLIGHHYERHAAANAAKKAFIVTRVGDTAMLVGLALMFTTFGSLDFASVFGQLEATPPPDGFIDEGATTVISLLLLAGAVGKSAQLPLQTWLPDAMEGPTPVSALIHAATMVTAGVYLVVRSHPLFEASDIALPIVLVIGLVTALYAATSAMGQDDIKRVLAYSTISQIGLMFFAAGMRAYAAAIFLLVAHAFYKALLFLAAGSVMHALDGETDLKRMGGLRHELKLTFALFVVGWLAIAGFPGLSGFFAKDQVVAYASETGRVVAWIFALVVSFLSALYVSRVVFLAFFGVPRHDQHPHESPPVMTIPMVLLAAAAVIGGLLGLSAAGGVLSGFLEPVVGPVEEGHEGPSVLLLTVVSVIVALLGIGVGWLLYGSGRFDWVALRARFRRTHATLQHGWWFDTVYGWLLVTPGKAGAAFTAYVIDRRVVDGSGNLVARFFGLLANSGRRLQTGLVRVYALAFLIGVVALLMFLAVKFG